LKRLIILGLVVALVAVMSAPAALFATGGGGNDHNGKGKGHCKNIDKPGHKKCKKDDDKHHKKCKKDDGKHHKKCKKKKFHRCDTDRNGIVTPSEKEYCKKDDHHGGHHGGHNGDDD
jgi:hypothetical protein